MYRHTDIGITLNLSYTRNSCWVDCVFHLYHEHYVSHIFPVFTCRVTVGLKWYLLAYTKLKYMAELKEGNTITVVLLSN